jgi:hypothetical protein
MDHPPLEPPPSPSARTLVLSFLGVIVACSLATLATFIRLYGTPPDAWWGLLVAIILFPLGFAQAFTSLLAALHLPEDSLLTIVPTIFIGLAPYAVYGVLAITIARAPTRRRRAFTILVLLIFLTLNAASCQAANVDCRGFPGGC